MRREEKQNYSELQQNIKAARLNVHIVDVILFALVISTMAQLADVLGHGSPNWSDWLKSGGFSLAELFFAHAVSRAHLTNTRAWPLWVVLISVMLLIIPMNLIYAWQKSYEFADGHYTEAIMSSDVIVNYLAAAGSGIISLLIAGMSIVRLISEKSVSIAEQKLEEYEQLIEQRRINRERQRKYRESLADSDVDSDYIKKQAQKLTAGKRRRKGGKK